MSERNTPQVGEWYKMQDGVSFEVTATDIDEGMVTIQFFDGAIEEVSLADWEEMALEAREPPADDWQALIAPLAGPEGEEPPSPPLWSGPLDSPDIELEWGE